MSAYFPPLENLPIFDASQFSIPNGDNAAFLTKSEADRLYLQYPFGQGEQNIPELIVAGSATIGEDIIMSGTANTNYVEYPDNTKQYSANTGAGSLAGSYTNTNMTIDSDGKITALTSGSAPVNLLPLNNTWTGTNTFQNFVNLESATNIRGANVLNLFDRQSTATNSAAFQDVGVLTIQNNAVNGSINFDTTSGSGATTTNLSLGSTSSVFSKDTYVNDSVFVMRDNDTTTTQVNMTYQAGTQVNFNLAPSTMNPTTTFQCYLDPSYTVISPLQINNTGIIVRGTAPITFPDNKVQNSAFTGGTPGAYTNTNMTIDANGKISAISNGSAGASQNLASVLATTPNAGNGGNLPMTGLSSITLTNSSSAVQFGGVSRAVQSSDYSNSASQPISMETIVSARIQGKSDNITLTIPLQQNYNNTTNYMVFPSVYYGYSGSGGTYNASGTANALNSFIIYDRKFNQFSFYCSKATNDNVNIYITFLVIYNGGGSTYPASY